MGLVCTKSGVITRTMAPSNLLHVAKIMTLCQHCQQLCWIIMTATSIIHLKKLSARFWDIKNWRQQRAAHQVLLQALAPASSMSHTNALLAAFSHKQAGQQCRSCLLMGSAYAAYSDCSLMCGTKLDMRSGLYSQYNTSQTICKMKKNHEGSPVTKPSTAAQTRRPLDDVNRSLARILVIKGAVVHASDCPCNHSCS